MVGVFIGMLVVYKTGAIRVTPRLTKMIIGAAIGVLVLMVANLLVGFFVDGGLGTAQRWTARDHLLAGLHRYRRLHAAARLRPGGPGGQGRRPPRQFAWYLAFGFMTTLVWLYIEILRLLSYFRQ